MLILTESEFYCHFVGDRSGLAPIWNDEDERDFYENYPDLKATMPSMAYKDSIADAAAVVGDQTGNEEAMAVLDAVIEADSGQAEHSEESHSAATVNKPDESTVTAGALLFFELFNMVRVN